jgi:hypothetical protein
MSNIPISSLPIANPLSGEEMVPIVQAGTTKRTTAEALGAFPFGTSSADTFVTVSQETGLSQSRQLVAVSPLVLTDNGAGSTFSLTFTGALGVSGPLSVLGNSSTATAIPGDLTGSANQVLRVNSGGTALTFGAVNLASGSAVSGVLGVSTGGLGTSSPTANSVLLGQGASPVTVVANATAGYVLTATGAGSDPTFQAAAAAGVTSVSGTGGTTGLTVTGGPITSVGTLTLGGILIVPNGGTGTSALGSNALLIGHGTGAITSVTNATAGYVLMATGTASAPTFQQAGTGLGTVTSVNAAGGTTGLTFSGGPITSVGTLTLGGVLVVSDGGTGTSSLTANNLLLGQGTGAIIPMPFGGATGQILAASTGAAPGFTAQPTLNVSLTVPKIIGGTATGSTLILLATSGAGAGSESVSIAGGPNGASTFAVFNSLGLTVGTATNGSGTIVVGARPNNGELNGIYVSRDITASATGAIKIGSTIRGTLSHIADLFVEPLAGATAVITSDWYGISISGPFITTGGTSLDYQALRIGDCSVVGGGGTVTGTSRAILVEGGVSEFRGSIVGGRNSNSSLILQSTTGTGGPAANDSIKFQGGIAGATPIASFVVGTSGAGTLTGGLTLGYFGTSGNIAGAISFVEGSAADGRGLTIQRSTVASTGANWTVSAGGAKSGASNSKGGDILFVSGVTTGNATSGISFYAFPGNAGATSDNALTLAASYDSFGVSCLPLTPLPAGGTNGLGFKFTNQGNFGIFFGSGAPTLTAIKGSLYLRSDGTSTATRMYINTDGAATWTGVLTVA